MAKGQAANSLFAFLLFLLLSLPASSAFVNKGSALSLPRTATTTKTTTIKRHSPVVTKIRGGGLALHSTMSLAAMDAALKSGPLGVVALAGVASSVGIPLTMYRQGYSFSVGYGFSVMAMGIALFRTFEMGALGIRSPLFLMALSVIFYGARLGSFLLIREWTVPSKAKTIKEFDKAPRLKRIPLALSVSIFYAFMTSPLLYAARATGANIHKNTMLVGVGLAWLGAGMEAIADWQKFWVKRRGADETTFVGPTGGVYRLCRHPNYFAEVMYWFGLLVAGVPSFGKSILAYACGSLGFFGIYSIMSMASKRLDGKQDEKYKGQKKYASYKLQVPASLWPWVRSS